MSYVTGGVSWGKGGAKSDVWGFGALAKVGRTVQ